MARRFGCQVMMNLFTAFINRPVCSGIINDGFVYTSYNKITCQDYAESLIKNLIYYACSFEY